VAPFAAVERKASFSLSALRAAARERLPSRVRLGQLCSLPDLATLSTLAADLGQIDNTARYIPRNSEGGPISTARLSSLANCAV
jgi:hypothetical protein